MFRVSLCIVIITSLVMNSISLIMAYTTMDFTDKRAGEFTCVLLHLVQLGPVWRYLKLLATGIHYKEIFLSIYY